MIQNNLHRIWRLAICQIICSSTNGREINEKCFAEETSLCWDKHAKQEMHVDGEHLPNIYPPTPWLQNAHALEHSFICMVWMFLKHFFVHFEFWRTLIWVYIQFSAHPVIVLCPNLQLTNRMILFCMIDPFNQHTAHWLCVCVCVCVCVCGWLGG